MKPDDKLDTVIGSDEVAVRSAMFAGRLAAAPVPRA
jgi:hypothetical protein